MTDAEIIKALETHLSNEGECSECAYFENIGSCVGIMHKDLYDLINRQKAEISVLRKLFDKVETEMNNQSENMKKLTKDCYSMQSTLAKMSMGVEQAKAEAIKEFAERMKEHKTVSFNQNYLRFGFTEAVDILVKEMVGEG